MEKAPLSSKKFIAFLLAEVTWKLILLATLLAFRYELQAASVWGWWFMLSIVIVAGFVEVGFIGGQAWLDRYVRVAKIAARGPQVSDPDPTEDSDSPGPPKLDPDDTDTPTTPT